MLGQVARQSRRRRRRRAHGQREGDGDAAGQEAPPGKKRRGVHARAAAARRMARRIRMCVPHRQRLGAHCRADLLLVRVRRSPQQSFGAHDHPGDAVAALRGLLGLERGLHRAQLPILGETFDGGDLAAAQRGDGREAGEHGGVADEHGAGPALPEAASEFRAVQLQAIAQHVEQRFVGFRIDAVLLSVDADLKVHGAVSLRASRASRVRSPVQAGRSLKRERT